MRVGALLAFALLASGALLLGGCVLDEVGLDGKACPCIQGFVCDTAQNLCVPEGQEVDAGLPDTGVVPDAGEEDAGAITCSTDRDCGDPPNRVCSEGVCIRGCHTTGGAACLGSRSCDDTTGHCLVSGACEAQSDCDPPISVCVAGACEPGCSVSTHPCRMDRTCAFETGLCEASPACSADTDCPFGYWCDGRSCRQRCDSPGAPVCRGNSTCDTATGRCTNGLDIGEACTSDAQCASGECLGLVVGGQNLRICSRTCGASAECPLGSGCFPVSDGGQCLPGSVFQSMPELSSRSGESCPGADNDCQSQICINNQCVESCGRDRDCSSLTGACKPSIEGSLANRRWFARCQAPLPGFEDWATCSTNLDCASGLCDPVEGRCTHFCCSEADCGPDKSCVAIQANASVIRVCRDRRSSGGRVLGGPCALDTDCESDLCSPIDPANPNGGKICSTYCCNNADCDVMPASTRRQCVTQEGPIANSVTGRCIGQ